MSERVDPGAGAGGRVSAWALGVLGAAGVAILLVLAALDPGRAVGPLAGAALLCVATLALMALRERPVGPGPVSPALLDPAPPFAAVVEHLVDPILLVAGSDAHDLADRRFLFANAAARELLRVTRQAGPLTTAIRAPEVLSAVEEALFGALSSQAIWRSRGMQERFWRVRIVGLPPEQGSAAGPRLALLTFGDETEMRRSEATRADFLANASHELRTPLASLAGFVETLRGHARDDPGARDRFLAIMHAQTERMRQLIDDLMSLSRIELNEHVRPVGRVDLTAVVADVVDALAPQAAERSVTFRIEAPANLDLAVTGDRDQLVQVVQNLVENAVKYTPAGGVVGVELRAGAPSASGAPRSSTAARLSLLTPDFAPAEHYVSLCVADQGAGIARNHLPRLTERFYRVEGQKARERPGTGLGLAIVKHIVNRHRGGLTVESEIGAGAAFTVYVPAAGPAARVELSEAAPIGAGK